MSQLTVVYTKSPLSPLSWLVRWALPRSRFALALSSHCVILDNEDEGYCYHAMLGQGVRKITVNEAYKGSKIVKVIKYNLPDVKSAMRFLDSQCGKGYDLKGAFGISISPDRDWSEDDKWFCYELTAAAIKAGGRDVFTNLSHITEIALMALKP